MRLEGFLETSNRPNGEREVVQKSRSDIWKSPVAKRLGPSLWNNEKVGTNRTQGARTSPPGQKEGKVRRCETLKGFGGKEMDLELNPKLHGKPVELVQERF